MVFSILFIIFSTINRWLLPLGFDYIIYSVFIGFFILYVLNKGGFCINKGFSRLFIIFLLIIAINGIISQYVHSFLLFVIGTILTLLPFIHFAVSYNFNFSSDEIDYFIDLIIKTIIVIALSFYIEVVIHTVIVDSIFINSSIFMYGFFASLCNQAIILSLAQYHKLRKNKYIRYIIFLSITVVITLQLKAIIALLIVFAGYFFYMHKHKIKVFLIVSVSMFIVVAVLLSIPSLNDKIKKYAIMYNFTVDNDIPRILLYKTSFSILYDFFPFGTGQGTFGSVPVNIEYSKVYSDYGIDNTFGLRKDDIVEFKMDTHWSSIIGENGIIGLILYVLLMTYAIRKYKSCVPSEMISKSNMYILTFSTGCMILESIALPLPNRLSFIVIYSGLSAIILKHEKMNCHNYKTLNK
ncbi:MAG: O-antigen ligase family protein [Endomicrobium sp.]|jgi:hypothetical protein|nr:O-antigen ligase family protein [Endomicrobium sp.]